MGEKREKRKLGDGTEITREREKEKNCVCIGTDFDVNAWKGKETADCSYRLLSFSLSSQSLSCPKPRIFRDAIGAALIVLISFSFCFPQKRDNTTAYVFRRHLRNTLCIKIQVN